VSANLPRRLNAKVVPHRSLTGPLAIPEDRDGVADSVSVAGANLYGDLVCAGLEGCPGHRRGFGEVELNWHGSDHFRAMSISSRAGQSTCRKSMWRSEPGCTDATVKGGLDPDQLNGSPIGFVSAIVFSESASGRNSVTITTTSSAVSFPSRLAHPQPNTRCVQSCCCPDDDLIVSSSVKTKIQLRSAPRRDEKISEQRVDNRSDRADGHRDRGPSIDGGAENGIGMIS
jgi:hypothetical protein